MKKLLAAFLIFASSAFAEFTPAEKDELRKAVSSAVHLSRAQEDLGFAVTSLGTANKAALLKVLEKVFRAQLSAMDCLDLAFSAESNGTLTREQEVAALKAAAKSLERQRVEAIALIDVMPQNANLAEARKRLVLADLSSFDQNLSYLEFRPADYPRMIGPHGDYDLSHAALEHMTQYTLHCTFDAINLWTNTTLGATANVKDFFRHEGRALDLMFRAWGMAGGIVLPDDAAKVNADLAAGSGLRPFDFFRVLLEVEYVFNTAQVNNFGGRKMDRGATSFVQTFNDAFTRMVIELSPEDKVLQFTGRHGAVSNTGPAGWASEYYFDLGDFWTALDGYGAGVMMFHHIIVGPPATPACPEFEAKMSLVDGVTARAECVETQP